MAADAIILVSSVKGLNSDSCLFLLSLFFLSSFLYLSTHLNTAKLNNLFFLKNFGTRLLHSLDRVGDKLSLVGKRYCAVRGHIYLRPCYMKVDKNIVPGLHRSINQLARSDSILGYRSFADENPKPKKNPDRVNDRGFGINAWQ